MLEVTARSASALSEKNQVNNQLEQWLDRLAQLRVLAFAENLEEHESSMLMVRLFELFEHRPHSAPFDLFRPSGAIRANRHIASRVRLTLSKPKIIHLLTFLAENNFSFELGEVATELLLDAYAGNNGFFITEEKFHHMRGLQQIGLRFGLLKKSFRNIGKYSMYGGFYRCQLKKSHVTDEIYTACLIISC